MEKIMNEDSKTASKSQKNDEKILESILNTNLPDWSVLEKKGEEVVKSEKPEGLVKWFETSKSISKGQIKNGAKYDIWGTDEFILLRKHPTLIDKFISFLISIFSIFLNPWYTFKNKLQLYLERLSIKIGSLFSILALPIALFAFLGDVITLFVSLLFSIPLLIFHPIVLVKTLLTLPFKIISILFARILWAFLIPMISKLLENIRLNKVENIKSVTINKPWVRFLILGFFRAERKTHPTTIIPTVTASQIFVVSKTGLFNKGEYVVIVEGEKINHDFMARLSSWFFTLILPYYWERTVHVMALPKDLEKRQLIIDTVSKTFKKDIENWK